jgi:hypothetical protein
MSHHDEIRGFVPEEKMGMSQQTVPPGTEPGWGQREVPGPSPAVDEKTWRKQRPVYSGVLAYFPDALLEVAYCSFVGNEQHNPGEPLHWAKEKSTDEPDALVRHLMERGKMDSDGVRHSAKAAWRSLALLQREIEEERRRGELP